LHSLSLDFGTFLIFSLAVAVFKHRFMADVRTSFLDDLGNDKVIDMGTYPDQSRKALQYMKKKQTREKKNEVTSDDTNEKYHGLWPEFMISWPSEKLLIIFMFLAVVVLSSLVIHTFLEICCGLGPLEEPGKIVT
jgi:hypothetical protein